jgi:hypothetical protein
MAANDTRGEISLELDGTEYVLRPSFEAIKAFEDGTGKKGVFLLGRMAEEDQLTLGDASVIVAECIKAHGRAIGDNAMAAVNAQRIGELIMASDGGFLIAMKKIALLLWMATTGGYTGSGEVKATTKK